jgi:hypothetical protein
MTWKTSMSRKQSQFIFVSHVYVIFVIAYVCLQLCIVASLDHEERKLFIKVFPKAFPFSAQIRNFSHFCSNIGVENPTEQTIG